MIYLAMTMCFDFTLFDFRRVKIRTRVRIYRLLIKKTHKTDDAVFFFPLFFFLFSIEEENVSHQINF